MDSGTAAVALVGPALLKAEYMRIRPMLQQFIRRRIRQPDMAEDFLNDIYLRLDRVDETLTVRAAATSYLYRMAVNVVTDYGRIQQRRYEMLAEASHSPVEHERSAEAEVMARSEMAIVSTALAELPEKARDMLVYSRVHGMKHAEIAEKMGVTKSLVEKYIARALTHCRQRLEDLDAASEARALGEPIVVEQRAGEKVQDRGAQDAQPKVTP